MGLIDKFDPYKSAGKTLMWLNVLGMLFAAASDTYAAASDKNTSKEDKKFLIPAGICTGVAKIGIYLGMTKKITEKLEGDVFEKVINAMKDKDNPEIMSDEFNAKALKFVTGKIEKATKGGLFGFGKKSPEYIDSMTKTLVNVAEDGTKTATDYAKELFKGDIKGGLSVLGAFTGAIVGCAIIAPILRDVSAYFIQKQMKKRNPGATEGPFISYTPTYMSKNMMGGVMNIANYRNAVKQGLKI